MRARKKWKLTAAAIFVVLAVASRLPAQNANSGEIRGTVTDSSGAVIPGSAVAIKNVQTGVVNQTTTNQSGRYDVPFMEPGSYTITFSKQGFHNFIREGIVLRIETLDVNATLQIGATTQQVVVSAPVPLLETQTTGQSVNLTSTTIDAAPITGVDWRSEMIQLIPGVNTGGGGGMVGGGQQAGINGTQGYNINFLTDGSASTDPRDFNNSNNILPIDSISEISINSSNAPAQYGNGLTAINVITKSGTNRWHGSAYEFIQNTALNARGFYNQSGAKAVEHWNNYGGSVGGPIKKNKLFFFFNYQRNPSSTPTSGLYSYPTAAMEAGDFYGITGSTNPAFFNPSGSLLTTQDPVALKLQSYFPAASAPGWVKGCPGPVSPSASNPQTCPAINNYVFNGSSPNTSTWYTGKVDYNIFSKQKLSVSFNYYPNFVSYVPPDPLYPNDASDISQAHNYNLTGQISDVYTITPTTLNEFRAGAMHELDSYHPPSLGKNDPATIGLEPAYGTNAPANVFPKVTVDSGAGAGCFALGAGCGENGNIDAVLGEEVYNYSDVLTLIRGKHTIKLGGEYDRDYQNYTNWGDITSGNFEFNGGVTGIPYADFLSGDVYGWYVYESDETGAHMWNSALFASDDYNVSPRVTLNLGLRWQMQSGWGVKGNLFGNYDPNLPNTADGGLYKGAILYGGQGDTQYGGPISKMTTIQNADNREFAPRVGIAWSPRQNWSIRASYGIFDAPRDAENYTDGALGLGFNPHNVGYGGYVFGSSPFKLAAGPPPGTVVFPTLQTLSPEIDNFSSVTYYPRNMPVNFVQQFLFSVQHEFAGGILLDTSFVHTHGNNLNFATNINQAPVGKLGCTGYNCGNPNPIFTSIQAQNYTGWSNYNALQIRLQKRMRNGLDLQVNYIWSKSMDTGTGNGHGSGVDIYQNAYNPAFNYALSNFDVANALVGQVVYALPFGSGRAFALHGIANQVAGGWRVSSIFQWHGGVPFTPVIQSSVATGIDPGLAPSLANGSTLYPELIGDPHVPNPTNGKWFNPAAYANPTPGTFGSSGRNTLIGPGYSDIDFSIAKVFPLHFESTNIEVRADMFNLLNHVNYANPDANVGYTSSGALADPTSGTITGPEGGSRIIQLGVHVTF
ncbi:MAG TPA: carboxypeptidase regulatory-like domain-containing protein [Terriglobia bacterium]|nr:carboxypeptidase regulatory-like domain-containing protein [Terriglobia bacterium]